MITTTRERPILFSGPMVRAILAGRKTVTRRPMRPQPAPNPDGDGHWWPSSEVRSRIDVETFLAGDDETVAPSFCPYGGIGDRLWVKETAYISAPGDFALNDCNLRDSQGRGRVVGYAASMVAVAVRCAEEYGAKKSPSIHMPRWASRITLEIAGVSVERLQAITPEDAVAEGLECDERVPGCWLPGYHEDPRDAFSEGWDQINGKRPGRDWAANPWVWVVRFKRVEQGERS